MRPLLYKRQEEVTFCRSQVAKMAKKRSGVEKWAEDKGSGKASVLAAVIWSNYI